MHKLYVILKFFLGLKDKFAVGGTCFCKMKLKNNILDFELGGTWTHNIRLTADCSTFELQLGQEGIWTLNICILHRFSRRCFNTQPPASNFVKIGL